MGINASSGRVTADVSGVVSTDVFKRAVATKTTSGATTIYTSSGATKIKGLLITSPYLAAGSASLKVTVGGDDVAEAFWSNSSLDAPLFIDLGNTELADTETIIITNTLWSGTPTFRFLTLYEDV